VKCVSCYLRPRMDGAKGGASADPLVRRERPAGAHPRLIPVTVAFLSLGAGALVLIATRHGPVITPDSTSYLSAAHNLASGRYIDFTLQPLTNFPPGLSVLLWFGERLATSGETASQLINAVSMVSTVVLAWALARRSIRSPSAALVVAGLTAASVSLQSLADKVVSEPLFIPLVLIALLLLDQALRSRSDRTAWWCVGSGVVTGIAFLVRYSAIALVVTGVIVLLSLGQRRPRTTRVVPTLAFSVAAVLLPLLWTIHNARLHTEDLLGARVENPQSLVEILRATARAVGSLYLPGAAQPRFAAVVGVGIIGIVVLEVWQILRRWHARTRTLEERTALVLAAFTAPYLAFAMVSYRLAGSGLDSRIMAPLYVPLLILVVAFLEQVITAHRWAGQRNVQVFGVVGLSLGLLAVSTAALANAWHVGASSREIATASGKNSSLVGRVRDLPSRALVATNAPYSLWYWSGHQPTVLSPGVAEPGVSLRPTPVHELERAACHRPPVYFAWFHESAEHDKSLESPSTLARDLALNRVASRTEGDLYRVRPRGAC
jgi:4-amino-4-deoxy-L-arabinose transferase-like glycosyltransferase